ncbi:heavy metal translocating P-type ATPase [Paenibacillus wenxiniae]|uniref:Heavy metal translocating P-type ATPase n=1 Tax=Paenibacillus wenxiniae TaxID=1636843 RepID=A0ABW4RDV7_9BACL
MKHIKMMPALRTARQGRNPFSSGGKGRQNFKALVQNREMQAALGSGALMLLAWLLSSAEGPGMLSVVLYICAYGIGGWQKAREGVETLIQERDLDVNLLMIAAAMGAATIGYWNEGAMLIFIFALSGALESYTNERSGKDISALLSLKPETALRMRDGKVEHVSIEQLRVGDLVMVKPGELIPADGTVVRGSSAVNQASITGESLPISKSSGDEVFTGTINGEGALYIEVTQSAEGTVFAKIIKMVESAQTEVPASQRVIKRFESLYARIVVVVTVLLIALLPLIPGWSWGDSFYKAMVFLVVASPCALVSSIMPVMLSAISNRARHGVLFKSGVHMENMSMTAVVAFDKTGTLTRGEPVVTDWLMTIAAEQAQQEQLLSIAAGLEAISMHPLARAIVQYSAEQGIEPQEMEHVQAITGWGIAGEWNGQQWKIGRADLLDQADADMKWVQCRRELEAQGKTVSLMLRDEQIVALIAIRDELRPQAIDAVRQLQALGIKVAMLTGDRPAVAESIGHTAGVDHIYAGLLPEDKVARVQELRERYGHVVMVGDGVNDAPALAAATVGLGMGMRGSGAALEVADVVLMNDGIEQIASTIRLARRARRIVRQNMIFALSVIILLIIGNFADNLALPLGVVGHEGSTILVILNGLRLLRAR